LPPLLARRARHVVTENARVLHTVTALLAGDLVAVGRLFAASQASMRDDYETSTPEIDLLAALGDEDPDVYGARLTGGGFGGSVVMLASAAAAAGAAARICEKYRAATSREAAVLVPAATPSADAPR
jgi:galactokinase